MIEIQWIKGEEAGPILAKCQGRSEDRVTDPPALIYDGSFKCGSKTMDDSSISG